MIHLLEWYEIISVSDTDTKLSVEFIVQASGTDTDVLYVLNSRVACKPSTQESKGKKSKEDSKVVVTNN